MVPLDGLLALCWKRKDKSRFNAVTFSKGSAELLSSGGGAVTARGGAGPGAEILHCLQRTHQGVYSQRETPEALLCTLRTCQETRGADNPRDSRSFSSEGDRRARAQSSTMETSVMAEAWPGSLPGRGPGPMRTPTCLPGTSHPAGPVGECQVMC